MSQSEPGGQRPPTVRLTFAYDANGIRLVSRRTVSKRVPPSDDLAADPPANAMVAELRAARDVPTFRRVLHEVIPTSVEVFDPVEGPSRRPGGPASGAFTVIVPNDERARDVVLMAGANAIPEHLSIALPEPARAVGLREIGRFSFQGDDRGHR